MKKVGLACTGGGTKAAVNIGVIRALTEMQIPITAISGTSIGSCIASLYAMGYTPSEILDKIKDYASCYAKLAWYDILLAPFHVFVRGGLKDPKIITQTIDIAAKQKGLYFMKDFQIPIFIPALDITKKETVYYTSMPILGETCLLDRSISEAVKSSSSFPVLFYPNTVSIDGKIHQMMDGGMECNVPTFHLKDFSDFVIGVEVHYKKKINHSHKVNFFTGCRNMFQAMRRSAISYQKENAHLWITIDLKNCNKVIGSPSDVVYCEKRGYEETMKLFKNEKKLLELLAIH